MSDQKSDVITPLNGSRARTFGHLGNRDQELTKSCEWQRRRGEQMSCVVFRVCEDELHAEEEEAVFRSGRCAELWCPEAEPKPVWNVLTRLRITFEGLYQIHLSWCEIFKMCFHIWIILITKSNFYWQIYDRLSQTSFCPQSRRPSCSQACRSLCTRVEESGRRKLKYQSLFVSGIILIKINLKYQSASTNHLPPETEES